MLAQRATQQSLRRLAAGQPSMISQMAMKKFAAPAVLGSAMQTRPVATTKLTPESSYDILVAQRKKRPTAPHLSIYKWQITSVLSISNRMTGLFLSGGFYAFGLTYLASPLFGWDITSTTMAAAFGAWPLALKALAKFTVAFPFAFHGWNGIRHLVWDLGKEFSNKAVIRTGWTVVGLSTASALYLALFA